MLWLPITSFFICSHSDYLIHYQEKDENKTFSRCSSEEFDVEFNFTGCSEGYITLSYDHSILTTFIWMLSSSNSLCHLFYSLVCFARSFTIFDLLPTLTKWEERNLTAFSFLWWKRVATSPVTLHVAKPNLRKTNVWWFSCHSRHTRYSSPPSPN